MQDLDDKRLNSFGNIDLSNIEQASKLPLQYDRRRAQMSNVMQTTNLGGDSVNFSGLMQGKEDSSMGDDRGDKNDDDSYFNLKRPESWSECLSIIWRKSEDKVLKMQNPDGLLYLSYLKYSGQLFSLRKCTFLA